jgi:hypothetical protein
MKFSLHQFLKAVVGLVADNHSADTHKGSAIDRLGFEEALVVVNSGANGASGTVDIKVQESDTTTDGDFADVAGAAFIQITEANDNNVCVGRLNLVGRKRYLRVVAVVGTAACDLGVEVILGAAKEGPVSQVNPAAFSL